MPFSHRLDRQLLLYLLFGLAQLALDTAVLWALTASGLAALPANVLSRLGAALFGFVLHRLVTFRADAVPARRAPLAWFLAWWTFCTLAGGWLLGLVLAEVGPGPTLALAKIAVEGLLALVSFVVFRTWVFAPDRR